MKFEIMLKKLLGTYIFLIGLCHLNYAQISNPTGVIIDESGDKDIPLLKKEGVKFLKKEVDLKKYCPPPGHQGVYPSCTGWAVGYYALTMLRAIKGKTKKVVDILKNPHSPTFIYNLIKEGSPDDCTKGARISNALCLLSEVGCCLQSDWKVAENACTPEPTTTDFQKAAPFRIKKYGRIWALDTTYQEKINATKQYLNDSIPVIVSINLTDNFGQISDAQPIWIPNNSFTNDFHAMVVVGYADQYFELVNSHGTDWGMNGFIKISENDFARIARLGFIMQLPVEQPISNEITSFTYCPIPSLTDKPSKASPILPEVLLYKYNAERKGCHFNAKSIVFNQREKIYQPATPIWELGSLFKLKIQNLIAYPYCYIFSFDAQQTAKLHWPISLKDESFTLQQADFMVPISSCDALGLIHSGKDYIIVLFSKKEIPNISERIFLFNKEKGDVKERFKKVFKKSLFPLVNYSPKAMTFTTFTEKRDQNLVPLVLLLQGNKN